MKIGENSRKTMRKGSENRSLLGGWQEVNHKERSELSGEELVTIPVISVLDPSKPIDDSND